MMTKRKERNLIELYDVTETLLEPEITPVLKGSCRIQGPVDETDHCIQTNTELSQSEKRFDRHSVAEKVRMRAESGTCNVCAAPCSSCMHFNRAMSRMELKAEDEFSDETSREKVASRCSFNVADVLPPFKSRACKDRQRTASETSNLLSASSSHDSFSENAESKATLRTFDASEDVEMHPKVLSGGTIAENQVLSNPQSVAGQSVIISSTSCVASGVGHKTFSSQYEVQKGLECHGDNISCVSGANDGNMPVGDLNVDVDRKNVSCSSASVSSFLQERFEKAFHVQTDPGCLDDFHYEIKESRDKSRSPSMFTKESIEKSPTISSATAGFLHKSDPSEVPSSKDICAGNNSAKVPSSYSHSRSGKSLFHNGDAKDLEENSCSHHQGEPSECSTEHVDSSLEKLATCDNLSRQKSATHNGDTVLPKFENNKANLTRNSSSGASMKIHPCLGAEVDMDTGNPPAEALNCSELNEQAEKLTASPEVPDLQEPPSQSQPVDESDGSDIVEDDVKVCDICGDAGREDMLAICSRCSDGAEHTYCMQIMVDKVPEGDWLCEECKIKEEAENQKQDKFGTLLGTLKASCMNEKSENSGGTINSKPLPKLDIKAPDVEATRAKVGSSPHFSSKRHSDNSEVASAAKRPALETNAGSPKPSSPSRKAALTRESSFRNLDKGKVKPVHQIHSSGGSSANNSQDTANSPTTSGHNSSRIQPRLQSPRGTLLKSNSFNTINSKPKVKMVLEDLSQKQKLAREPATSDTKKEGLIRTISKSLSFRTASPGRSNSTESKLKVHPSNLSRIEDLRGLKLPKERNLVERKNSFKLDRSLVSSPTAGSTVSTPKADQKIASRGETMAMLSSATNNRDLKAVQPDGKSNISSKTTTLLANRGSEIPSVLAGCGDVKRQSSGLSRGIGAPSLNGICNSAEQKPSQISPKDELTASSSWTADRTCGNLDAVLQDGLPQSRESTNQDGKGREPSFSRSRQSVSAGGRSVRCHKCKEMGHAAQFCPIGSPRVSVLEPSAARSPRDAMNKSITLKDAVEAAVLKRSGKQSRLPDQSDQISMSSTDLSCEVASRDQLSTSSSCLKNLTSFEGTHDGQESFRNSTADSDKNTTDVKQHVVHPTEAVCAPRAGDSDAIIPLDDNKLKSSMRDLPRLASSLAIPLRVLSIPEHEYIWQGGFEVQRSGRLLDCCDGIQAHLSTCASAKVLEVVNKFPLKVLLEEVPRSSMWPTQFQNCVTEDNIALYFFAKDLESYERNYKFLLENMMNNDLALKANFDGIELLIFPSNQLPEKSQRWNMLFFLWGVFRGRRVNCAEHISGSQKKLSGANLNVLPLNQEIPTPVIAVSEKECSSGNIDKDLSTYSRSRDVQDAVKSTASMDLPFLSSSGRVDTKCYTDVTSLDLKGLGLQNNFNKLVSVPGTNSDSRIPMIDAQLCTEMKGNNTSMEEHRDPESKQEAEINPCSLVTRQNSSHSKGKTLPKHLDNTNCRQAGFPSSSTDRQDTGSGSFKVLPVSSSSLVREAGAVGSSEGEIQERMKCSRDEVELQEKMRDTETALKGDALRRNLVEKDSCLEFKSSRKRPYSASPEMGSQASGETSTSTSQAMPWRENADCILVDGENESKRVKRCYGEMYSNNSSRDQNFLTDRFPSQIHNLGPSFHIKEQRLDEVYNDMVPPVNLRTTERYFFPIDVGPMKDSRPKGNTIPWQVLSSDDEDQVESEIPNLELALGAKKRPPKQEILPLFEFVDKKNNQGKLPDPLANNRDDDVSASLSLSLAFPFSDKEKTVKPVSKTEQLMPERHHVNTSLILFGGFADT